MSVINSDSVRAGASNAVATGYSVENSCRLNPADSAHMTFTKGTVADATIFSLATWFKRCSVTSDVNVFGAASGSGGTATVRLLNTGALYFSLNNAGGSAETGYLYTTQLFRDPSAWFHILCIYNTNESTTSDRMKVFINGVQVTSFSSRSDPSSGLASVDFNATGKVNEVGHHAGGSYAHGYYAQTVMTDGVVLTPANLGEFDDRGIYIPIDLDGLGVGTEGTILDYAVAPGTGNGAGTDVSGNANHYTDTNLAANDQMTESPTDSAPDQGNFCTWNPIYFSPTVPPSGAYRNTLTYTNGNLHLGTDYGGALGTLGVSSGKWYFELIPNDAWGSSTAFGAGSQSAFFANGSSVANERGCVLYEQGGNKHVNGTETSYGDTFTTDDVIGVALDMDNRAIWFSKNGTWSGEYYSPAFASYTTGDQCTLNTGQSAFGTTPPSGFKALCTANLPAPAVTDPSKFYQTKIFTGTGAELAITLTDGGGGAVKPDLVWIKDRDSVTSHVITDSARGATKEWNPDTTSSSEETTVAQGLKSFDTSGFTLGTDTDYNASSSLNVAWCWNTQGGAGSSNEAGTINTTTTSVGTTQGLSISTYTGTGSAGATIGHGLGVTPEFIFVKSRSGAHQGRCYHHKVDADPETKFLDLSAVDALGDALNVWNDTAPTSTVVSLGDYAAVNGSGVTHLAYCWVGVEGYSKFGSFESNNNADGPFVWCGFRPALIIYKSIDGAEQWMMWDTKRSPYNMAQIALYVDNTTIESAIGNKDIDILSNGFKPRETETQVNNAGTFIFAAWAEFPFGGSGVSQARAR